MRALLTLTLLLSSAAPAAYATSAQTLREQIAAEVAALVSEAKTCEDTEALQSTLELLRSRRRLESARNTQCLRFSFEIYDQYTSPSSRALALAKAACKEELDVEVLKIAFPIYDQATSPSSRALGLALQDARNEKLEGQATCLKFAFPIRDGQTSPTTRAWGLAIQDCESQ